MSFLQQKSYFRYGFLPDVAGIEGPAIHIVLNEGDSMLLPAGWIHCVFSPQDTVAFGCNFIVGNQLPMVARMYEHEVQKYLLLNHSPGTHD